MSAEVNNPEINAINREIYRTFKLIQDDAIAKSNNKFGAGFFLHELIVKDKPQIALLVKPKDFIYYINDEISQYDKSGNFTDRAKAIKVWNMLGGSYPPKAGGTTPQTYFSTLRQPNNQNTTAQKSSQNKYREAYY
jgi:hypothetical protein